MPINALADFMGMPVWFVGGALGLGVMLITMALSIRFLKARGIMVSTILMIMLVVNVIIFSWPFWTVLVVGAGVLWQLTATSITLRLPLVGRLGRT